MGQVNVTSWMDRKVGAVIAVLAHEDTSDRFECELAMTQSGGKGGDFPNGPVPPAGDGLVTVRPGSISFRIGSVSLTAHSTLLPEDALDADMACVFIAESKAYDPHDRTPKSRMGITVSLHIEERNGT